VKQANSRRVVIKPRGRGGIRFPTSPQAAIAFDGPIESRKLDVSSARRGSFSYDFDSESEVPLVGEACSSGIRGKDVMIN